MRADGGQGLAHRGELRAARAAYGDDDAYRRFGFALGLTLRGWKSFALKIGFEMAGHSEERTKSGAG